jgi:hypothetical protein
MTVDERVRGILETFGLYTTALPGAKPAPFEGSPASTPVYGHCAQMLDAQRRVNPEAYRLVTQGVGLDAVRIPPAAQFTLGHTLEPTTTTETATTHRPTAPTAPVPASLPAFA